MRIPRKTRTARRIEIQPDLARRSFIIGGVEVGDVPASRACLIDLLAAGPEILESYRVAVRADANGVARDVEVDSAGQSEGDHKRWRCQEAVFEIGMDAAREIAVTRKYGDGAKAWSSDFSL